MIVIDLDADLNMEDDEGRNFTVVEAEAERPVLGRAVVAGRPDFWSWVVVDSIEEISGGSAIVTFRQVSAKGAAAIGPLVAGVH